MSAILAVCGDTFCAIVSDGRYVEEPITGEKPHILKNDLPKVRKINRNVVVGFAGSVSDAFALSEKFEAMLQKYSGNLMRAAVELAELWRNDKGCRRLEALLIAADSTSIYVISGTGEVIEPENGIVAIGSGGNYALAAARALADATDLSAKDIAYKALKIASEICVYTNDHITVETV